LDKIVTMYSDLLQKEKESAEETVQAHKKNADRIKCLTLTKNRLQNENFIKNL